MKYLHEIPGGYYRERYQAETREMTPAQRESYIFASSDVTK